MIAELWENYPLIFLLLTSWAGTVTYVIIVTTMTALKCPGWEASVRRKADVPVSTFAMEALVFAPLLEEILFRAIPLGLTRHPVMIGIVVWGFAFAHFVGVSRNTPPGRTYLLAIEHTICSAIFTYVFLLYGLCASILFHAAHNLLPVTFYALGKLDKSKTR